MKITGTFTAANAAEWRAWLQANHASEKEIWLVYFKGSMAGEGIDYETSVEEALCFGWIDSIIQKIDEQRYARKFNPRRPGSFWSATNKTRMKKLVAEGRMTAAGLAKFDPQAEESQSETALKIRKAEIPIPEDFLQAVAQNPQALEFYKHLAPSKQRVYSGWVMSAKRSETRQKRLAELIGVLEAGKELGMK